MNLYFLLITLTIVNAGVIPDTDCDGVTFDGVYHDREILKTELDRPYLLAVDYNTNIIYFSYNVNETVFRSARFDLDTKEFKDINDVPNGFTQAVDQTTHTAYIGGSDGIYKYDHKNHKSEIYVAKEKDIWRIFAKDVLYFSEFPNQFMYTYVDGNIARFKDLEDTKIDQFAIDNDDVMFYTNDTGFYSQKKGGKDAVLYSDKLNVRAITVDTYGKVYMCSIDTIFKVNKESKSLEKLMDIDDCFGLAFDSNNNLIYSDDASVVRLKINKDKSC